MAGLKPVRNALAVLFIVGLASHGVLGGNQFDLGEVEEYHRVLMRQLKEAQSAVGIEVDDVHLFENPDFSRQGRQLQQSVSEITSELPLQQIFTAFMSLIASGATTGIFPYQAFPGLSSANSFGYSPVNGSFCLFGTKPGTPSPSLLPTLPQPGASPPIPPITEIAGGFYCVQGPPTAPGAFPIEIDGTAYACLANKTAPPPTGRRLLASSLKTAASDLETALSTLGSPIWQCVVSTTPAGVTTFGEAAVAVLNDLGIVAEHLLIYLNGGGNLNYTETVLNDFLSLENPLYPTGPRLNFSVDFDAITHDLPLLEEFLGYPPASPVYAASPDGTYYPASPPGYGPAGSTGDSVLFPPVGPEAAASPLAAAIAPVVAAVEAVVYTFDGYLDQCQVVLGSLPHADGNFDRPSDFTTTVVDGMWNLTTEQLEEFAGQVGYIVPSSKSLTYAPLTLADRSSATYCYDIATLQPVYNPMAVLIPANGTNPSELAATALSTLLVFGEPYGLQESELHSALSIPSNITIATYPALPEAINGDGTAFSVLKDNVYVSNIVTLGTALLTNDSAQYPSIAIILDQTMAQMIVADQGAPMDLANSSEVTSILTGAEYAIPQQSDEATRQAVTPGLTAEQVAAVGLATANLNAQVALAPDVTTVETISYYSQTTLTSEVKSLLDGSLSLADFEADTTPSALASDIAATTLPGVLEPTSTTPTTLQTSTQSASSSSSGLSHGGKVALATVLPIVGVIAIVAAVAFIIMRRRGSSSRTLDSPNSNRVWWKSPIFRRNNASSPSATPMTA